MYQGVANQSPYVNTMDQDVSITMTQDVAKIVGHDAASQDAALGVTMTITQADLEYLRAVGRLGDLAVVYRVWREQAGGGFGDQTKNPQTWGVLVYVDEQLARIYSARGSGREWSNLDRLEKWLRAQGFWYWWTRNDLEPLGEGDDTVLAETDTDTDSDDEPQTPAFDRVPGLPESGRTD